jgi:hypothetical protein
MVPARATPAGQVTQWSCIDVTMRSENQMTWGWSDILMAVGETDAALRRKLQRDQVRFEAERVNGRTRATIWDIARLRLSRHFCSIAMEPKEAFSLASFVIDLAFKDLITDGKFTAAAGKKQGIVFAVFRKSEGITATPRLIRVNPSDPKQRAKAFKELALLASDPENGIFPVHWAVLDAWSKLPDIPGDLQAWINASREKMQGIFA